MGKNSLIKSTSKKKKTAKKNATEEKPAVKSKSTAKSKATKTKKAAAAKTGVKATKTVKAKTTAKAKPPKEVSIKDLIFKKFEPLAERETLYTPAGNSTKNYSAPPFISSEDPNEIERIKKLLTNKYSMADLRAAAEKAAAEKAAAEKAAAEKAAAEKAAAEKAAAEKAAAEKAAAEKAAAEKAAAEKAAAEKAAAEKAAAEKAAAEKAAAEKAAAEKAAAEKAAAEKAAAEKAAAEKAAAEKAAAIPPLPVKKVKEPGDPQEKVMKIGLGVFALLIFYLILVSYSNMNTFSLKGKNGAVELWQGQFSPMGEELVMVLPGAQLPDLMKQSGSKKDIFPFVVNYYLDKADTIYEVPGIPDFQSIESYLNKAEPYAATTQLKNKIDTRKTTINFTVLLTRAEVAINSGTPEGLKSAVNYLNAANKLDIDEMKTELVNKKLQAVEAMLTDFEISTKSPEKKIEAAPESSHHP